MALMQAYFNLIYNPVYDFTTARTTSYRKWQETCLDKLQFADGDRVLCVGAGTGNEIVRILERNDQVNIVAIDASERALGRAYTKVRKCGKEVKLVKGDAQKLNFPDASFDIALCVHLMDFLKDSSIATAEILRVLRKGGQFVITYPCGEGATLMITLAKESLRENPDSRKYGKAIMELLALIGSGLVYLPLLGRSKRTFYSHSRLDEMFAELKPECIHTEEHSGYQDFIVSGKK